MNDRGNKEKTHTQANREHAHSYITQWFRWKRLRQVHGSCSDHFISRDTLRECHGNSA